MSSRTRKVKATKAAKPKRRSSRAVKAGAAAALVTLSSYGFYNAVAATATIPILARIMRAIEVTINTSIDFGTLAITEDVAGTATLDPLTSKLRVDSEGGINLAGGFPTAGNVRIKGAPQPVQISLDTNVMRITNGTTYLTINNFNINTANGGPNATITPSGPGNSVVFSIGATLNARPNQVTGTYIGTNTIFANYQ